MLLQVLSMQVRFVTTFGGIGNPLMLFEDWAAWTSASSRENVEMAVRCFEESN
jgi:hypothetical protein